MSKRVCAVTGASGFVGAKLCEHLLARGWEVARLGRRPGETPFSLGRDFSAAVLRERSVSALVHCAYDFSPRSWPEIDRVNVQGSARLAAAAREAGVSRLVLISSMAAFDGCRSLYGRAKLEIEAAFAGGVVIRPGLVYGDSSGGLVGTMTRLMAKLPLVPVIAAGQPLYCCHVDDLGRLVTRVLASESAAPPRPIVAASERPLAFREILRHIARGAGRSPLFVPIPWRVAWAGLKMLEGVGARIGLRSDSVLSLVNQNPNPDFSTARSVGFEFRSLA